MFLLKTVADLHSAFRNRDRAQLVLPEGRAFPLFVRDYLAWLEPGGARIFLVFSAPGDAVPTGVAFRRDQSGDRAPPAMCAWCHASGSSDEIGLITADAGPRRRVGIILCRDLRCGERLEEAADRAGRNGREQVKALLVRMREFTEAALGITQHNR